MRWEDERYVRVFTRDTPSWDAMGWEAQALLVLIFRKMDRTGLLALGNSGRRGLAACVRMPIEVVDRALDVLLEDGVLTMSGKDIFCPNFMVAQECAKSDSLRSREKRERAHVKLTQSVSAPTQSVAQATRSDTSVPRSDTPSVPYRADPDPNTPLPPKGGQVELLPRQAKPKKGIAPSAAFARFWEVYPRHVAKQAAIKAWPGDEMLPVIMRALDWQAPEFRKREQDKIPHPATWLNGKRWEDEKPKAQQQQLSQRWTPTQAKYPSLKAGD